MSQNKSIKFSSWDQKLPFMKERQTLQQVQDQWANKFYDIVPMHLHWFEHEIRPQNKHDWSLVHCCDMCLRRRWSKPKSKRRIERVDPEVFKYFWNIVKRVYKQVFGIKRFLRFSTFFWHQTLVYTLALKAREKARKHLLNLSLFILKPINKKLTNLTPSMSISGNPLDRKYSLKTAYSACTASVVCKKLGSDLPNFMSF